jgi:benzoyl-CoA reductase/2-hydroxyglutaryl-CoA dehydratase subunit BcrC/BadD/HgdB
MKTIDNLSTYLKDRVSELEKLKKQGTKIIGYVPGGFVPEEIIWAAGAIPVALNRGGNYEAVLKSLDYIPRVIDTYSRCQIGYWGLGEPLYRMADLVVVPCTDKNIAAIADCWEMWTDTKLFRFGVPHNNTTEHAYKYFYETLAVFKQKIEEFTGNKITDSKLKEEIETGNKIRRLLKQIGETRKSDTPPISGSEYIKLHHASMIADRHYIVNYMESLLQELKNRKGKKGPRVFLIGSSLAEGDYKVHELLESAGANIVMEAFDEGMKPFRQEVETSGDLLKALADAYFKKITPSPAFFRPTQGRLDFLLNLAKEYKVNGIVWYSMQYREAHEIEGIHFGRKAEKQNYHFLRVVTDYDNEEYDTLRTRLEAFTESL